MIDAEFKQTIAAAFIGSWLANNYYDACHRGEQERLSRPPVEDAEFLAEKAVQQWNKLVGAKP
jgi:hypothetical protein